MNAIAGALSNAVDLYNSATGMWSTAQLSVARAGLAATSVGDVALFGGGASISAMCRGGVVDCCVCVEYVSMVFYFGFCCSTTGCCLMSDACHCRWCSL
jgi:hypothetical protein